MSIATDGLSSNWTLSLWDELRAALMLHHQGPLEKIAERFMRAVTLDAATAIRSEAGRIETGRPADLTIVTLPSRCTNHTALALHTILHTKQAASVYIDGTKVL